LTLRSRRARLAGLAVLVLVAAAVIAVLGRSGEPSGPRALAPGRGTTESTRDPFAYDAARRADFEARAAAGLSHVLYAKSPGGVPATARRVQRWRPAIEEVAARAGQDPDTIEAIVFLESAGRPEVSASDDLESAVGLTQILAQTGADLLGLKVDVAASERITRQIGRATSPARIARLKAQRRRVDERFDPRKALEATARYLEFAKGHLGRDDLTVVSYHMGVGNLQRALKAYGSSDIPYAQLFFDSTPVRHAAAWKVLASLGDDSSTYLWRIGAAKAIMSLHREGADGQALAAQALLQASPAGERVLRPASTPVFADDEALQSDELATVDGAALRPSRALAARPASGRALRPEALALLRFLALGVREVSRTAPITVTSAARSVQGEERDTRGALDAEAPPSTHATGYAFDISRDYRTPAQAQALQFWLDRLTALDVIRWVRQPDVIHVTVGPRAGELS
jgi:hypothetical protein